MGGVFNGLVQLRHLELWTEYEEIDMNELFRSRVIPCNIMLLDLYSTAAKVNYLPFIPVNNDEFSEEEAVEGTFFAKCNHRVQVNVDMSSVGNRSILKLLAKKGIINLPG